MKIIVDAMGGDNAPGEIVCGALAAAAEYGCKLILCGDSEKIQSAAAAGGYSTDGHRIVHTDIAITMEDDPMVVLHAKKESSMCVGLRLLAAGEGDAFVSAGSTGALFTAASLIVRKIPGVQRAAIASILPMKPPVLLLDAGANVSLSDTVSVSQAIKSVHGVGLLKWCFRFGYADRDVRFLARADVPALRGVLRARGLPPDHPLGGQVRAGLGILVGLRRPGDTTFSPLLFIWAPC